MNSSNNLTPEQKIDEILSKVISNHWSLEDNGHDSIDREAKQQLLSLITQEKIKELEFCRHCCAGGQNCEYNKIVDRLQQLRSEK